MGLPCMEDPGPPRDKEAAAGGSQVFQLQQSPESLSPEQSLGIPVGTTRGAEGGRAPVTPGKDSPEQPGPECHQNLTSWPGKGRGQDPSEKQGTRALKNSDLLLLLILTTISSDEKIRGHEQHLIPLGMRDIPKIHSAGEEERTHSLPGQVFRDTQDFWEE